MQSSMDTIKNLLKNYAFYKMQAENGIGGKSLMENMRFIDNSINALSKDDKELIKSVFIDGLSVAKVAKNNYCHRNTVYNRVERIIELMAEVCEKSVKK